MLEELLVLSSTNNTIFYSEHNEKISLVLPNVPNSYLPLEMQLQQDPVNSLYVAAFFMGPIGSNVLLYGSSWISLSPPQIRSHHTMGLNIASASLLLSIVQAKRDTLVVQRERDEIRV